MPLPLITSNGALLLAGGLPVLPANENAFEFGQLTLAGEGGVTVAETSITAGNTSSHWTITGGKLVPTAQAVTDTYNAAPYTLTLDGTREVTITCPANVKHVDTLSQVNAALDAEVIVSGSTIKVRGGDKGGEAQYNGRPVENGALPAFTLEADNPANPPIFTRWRQEFSTQHGNFTLKNLKFVNTEPLPAKPIVNIRAEHAAVTLDGLEVSMSTVESILDQGFLGENYAVDCGTGSFPVTVQNCEIHHCGWGIFVRGADSVIEGNNIHHIFADGISIRGGTDGLTVRNNYIHTFIGDADYRHSDAIQFTDGGSGSITNVTIEGNVYFLGDFFANCQQSALSDRAAETVDVTATATLTTATHVSKHVRIDRSGPAITVTLPPASECPQESIWILPLNGNEGTGDLPFTVSGASGGDVVASEASTWRGRTAFRSNGTIWEAYPEAYWVGTHYINADYTVKARNSGNRLRIDASAGNITITLPATETGLDRINLHRVDNSANTVTVVASGSDTFSGQGTSGTSFTIPPRRSVGVQDGATPNWTVVSGRYDLEGIFGNPPSGGYDNIVIRGNIGWANSSEGVSLENHQGNFKLYNNTFVSTYMPDSNSDGVVNGFDGAYPQGIAVKMQANPTVADSARFSANNFVSTQGYWDNWEPQGGQTPTYSQDNIVLTLNQATTAAGQDANIATLATYVQGSTYADWYPTTVDEAIDAVLAKVGGALDGTYIGAVGTTRSNGYWDFTTGQKNPSAPEPTIP